MSTHALVYGLGAQYSGPITALEMEPVSGASSLVGFDASGNQVWSRANSNARIALMVEPSSGTLFYEDRLGASPEITSAKLFEASPDGSGEHLIESCDGDCSKYPLAANAQGDRVTGEGRSEQVVVTVTLLGGTSWSLTWTPGSTTPMVNAAAFAPDGNVVLAGSVQTAGTFEGHSVAPGPVILKLDRAGKVLWLQQLSGDGNFYAVGTSAKGTVVALGTAGASNWAGQDVAAGTVLVTAESNGTPRWARPISTSGSPALQRLLAVDPAGQVAFVTTAGCSGATVMKYDLAGDFLWKRTFAPSECDSNHWLDINGIALSKGDVVVGGQYQGTVDFGTGAKSASAQEGFVIKLAK